MDIIHGQQYIILPTLKSCTQYNTLAKLYRQQLAQNHKFVSIQVKSVSWAVSPAVRAKMTSLLW